MNDAKLEQLIKPIIRIYDNIEIELIRDIANRLNTYDGVKGSLKWYLDKLQEMGGFTKDNLELLAEYSGKSQKEVREILKFAGYNMTGFDKYKSYYDEGLLEVNPSSIYESVAIQNIINNAINETNSIMDMIKTKAIESAKENYMNILTDAYIKVASGVYSYDKAIRIGLKKMAKKGFTGVTYSNGKRLSLEATVRRDVLTRVRQLVGSIELENAKKLNTNLVYVTQHLGARIRTKYTKEDYEVHCDWQGKVYMIEGSSDEYDNFYEKTGYGEMLGLCGVNCRHHFYPTFPWEKHPERLDPEENEREYLKQQEQRNKERYIRPLKREKEIYKQLDDKEEVKRINSKLNAFNKEYNKWLEDNGLQRDYSREYIEKDLIKNNQKRKTNVLGQSNSSNASKTIRSYVEKIELTQIDNKIQEYNDIIKDKDIEFAYVIQKDGEVFSFEGSQETVNIYDVDLDNATITHNHLKDKYDNMYKSFGEDDFNFLKKHPEINKLQEINEEYSYSVSVLKELDIDTTYARNKGLELMIQEVGYGDEQHYMFKWLRNEGYVDYERINNRTKEKD